MLQVTEVIKVYRVALCSLASQNQASKSKILSALNHNNRKVEPRRKIDGCPPKFGLVHYLLTSSFCISMAWRTLFE